MEIEYRVRVQIVGTEDRAAGDMRARAFLGDEHVEIVEATDVRAL